MNDRNSLTIGKNERLGVVTPSDLMIHSLKREALFFDRIVLAPHLTPPRSVPRLSEEDTEMLKANETYLQSKGLLIKSNVIIDDQRMGKLVQHHFAMDKIAFDSYASPLLNKHKSFDDQHIASVDRLERKNQDLSRSLITKALISQGHDAIPIFYSVKSLQTDSTDPRVECVALALRKLPLPDDSVLWEQILDFRREPAIRSKLNSFVKWMRRAILDTKDPKVVAEELKDLRADYERYIQMEKLSFKEGILCSVFAAIPALSSLDPMQGLLASVPSLLSVARFVTTMRNADEVAPGREIAYIREAESLFAEHDA